MGGDRHRQVNLCTLGCDCPGKTTLIPQSRNNLFTTPVAHCLCVVLWLSSLFWPSEKGSGVSMCTSGSDYSSVAYTRDCPPNNHVFKTLYSTTSPTDLDLRLVQLKWANVIIGLAPYTQQLHSVKRGLFTSCVQELVKR